MCTAISYLGESHFFGRNLDLEHQYSEQVVVCPRQFPIAGSRHHPALIGMATVAEGYPLYYEATNEYGLSVAALNFPGNGVYHKPAVGKEACASFDLIPYVLTRCKNTAQARALLENTVITDTPFSDAFPPTALHWLIADRERSFVAESMADGLHLYDNPAGVLTNNPPFPYMLPQLSFYMGISPKQPENRLAPGLSLAPFSRGLGGVGLPGDYSSPSRFVRAAFALHNSPKDGGVGQFFHILGAVEQIDGCVQVEEKFEKTLYSCCCDTQRGIYYYCTYQNRQLTAVDMHKENLDSDSISCFPLVTEQQIRWENGQLTMDN